MTKAKRASRDTYYIEMYPDGSAVLFWHTPHGYSYVVCRIEPEEVDDLGLDINVHP